MSDQQERPDAPPPARRRRERPQLSCNLCRRRKLRCDRQQPCGNCTHRGLGLSCAYAANPSRNESAKRPPTMQDRIQGLESLVVDLMQKTSTDRLDQQPAGVPGAPSPEPTAECSPATSLNADLADHVSPAADRGGIRLNRAGANYVNSAHWAAILDEISELKDQINDEKEADEESSRQSSDCGSSDCTGPQLLYGCAKVSTKEEILASIPTRPVVDRLVSNYFNSWEIPPAVLHSGQFLKEYEAFWNDPSGTPVIWLGLLSGIMCLATLFQKDTMDATIQQYGLLSAERDPEKMIESFRQNIVQCLILGDYAKGGPYVLETLILYVAAEMFLRRDAEIGVWIVLGNVVQLAMHMGYHRDPSHFTGMSPFSTEMRRRVWATVVELDLGTSAQMGLPRLIKPWQADTKGASNLRDDDFDAATTEMPLPRPETELTPILYRIIKARMMAVIGLIWDFAADTKTYTNTEVMDMDGRLQEVHKSIPGCLKWQSMAHCIMDSPKLIMQKLFLEIEFHRGRIGLHRRHVHFSTPRPPTTTTTTQHNHSKKTCLEAALKLLECQNVLHEETQPFGRLYRERWRISSLLNHDFLLATSIIGFYLQQTRTKAHEDVESPMIESMWGSLKRSYDIWLHSSSSSKEARKAVKALGVVLGSQNTISGPHIETNISSNDLTEDSTVGFGIQFPLFDATAVIPGWASPTAEPFEDFAGSTPVTNAGWRMMETADSMDSLRWP